MEEKTTISDPPAPAEISHPFHPAHKLKLVADDDGEFECDGCKETVFGARYTCDHDGGNCDFHLDTCCALAPEVPMKHPLFEGRAFVLVHEPPNPGPRICDACSDEVRGFVYHSAGADLDIHPCCTRLPPSIRIDGRVFDICNKKVPDRGCAACSGKKGQKLSKFWSYSCDWKGEAEFLHVACVKAMVRRNLKANRLVHDVGGKILGAKAPALEGLLQERAPKKSSRSKTTISDPPAPAEISHPFHPAHKLKLVVDDDGEFKCDGCKEPVPGARYTCEHDGGNCDFNLHTCCALAPDDLMKHPLFEGRAFVLVHEPPNTGPRICDACGDKVRGFVYHSPGADLDIHPCCTRLPLSIRIDDLVFDLCNKKVPDSCAACSRKNGQELSKFWSYSCEWEGKAKFLHVACVKAMVRRILKANRRVHDVGGEILGAKAPALEGLLQERAPKKSSRSGLKRFLKMAVLVIRVIVGVIVGDPTAMIVATVGALSSG